MDQLQNLEATVAQRLAELQPFFEEYTELQQVADRLGIAPPVAKSSVPTGASRKSSRRSTRKPAASRAAAATSATSAKPVRGGRRAGGAVGTGRVSGRADQILAMVTEQPGITVAEIGKRLGVDATGLYRPVHRLEQQGKLRKSGRELQPAKS
jgi:hypothetical protein